MSTNHNRINVADLEANQPNKILKTNQNGELEFIDVNNIQTNNRENYKVYTAIINQTKTNSPVATVLENTLNGNIIFNYSSTGTYIGNLTGAFPEGKTFFLVTPPYVPGSSNTFYIGRVDNDTISLAFRKNMSAFNEIENAMLEIRIYS